MAAPERYTAEQVISAIRETRGMLTITARRLGCAYNTVRNYIDNYPTVRAALEEAREGLGDKIELTLVNEALGVTDEEGGYTKEPNPTLLMFLAKTRLRNRGYGDHTEITGADGGPLDIVIKGYVNVSPDDL